MACSGRRKSEPNAEEQELDHCRLASSIVLLTKGLQPASSSTLRDNLGLLNTPCCAGVFIPARYGRLGTLI